MTAGDCTIRISYCSSPAVTDRPSTRTKMPLTMRPLGVSLRSREATAPQPDAYSSRGASPVGTNFVPLLVLQRLLNLPDDRVIGGLVAVKVVDRCGQEVRLPARTDTSRVFENRGQELVLVGVITGFPAQPTVRR